MNFIIRLCVAAAAAAFVSGCVVAPEPRYRGQTVYLEGLQLPERPQPTYMPVEDTFSYWDDDGTGGSPRIEISISEQAAYFYRGDHLVGRSRISTGTESHPTPVGDFKVVFKNRYHKSNLYGDYVDAETGVPVMKNIDVRKDKAPAGCVFDAAKMYYYLQFYPATGMHAGFLPGYPASHGCVRLPEWMAEHFFANAPVGTPVIVRH